MSLAGIESEIDIWSTAWENTLLVNLIAVADLCRGAIQHLRQLILMVLLMFVDV